MSSRLFALFLALAAPGAIASPAIQHWVTANGMRVYFVHAPELPMIDLRVAFDAGSARDGASPGISRVTTSLLDEGAGPWDADTIAGRFEDVGAEYSGAVERDMVWLSLRSLLDPAYFEPALETFITVLGDPRFDSRDVARIKRLTLVALQQQDQEPADVAEKAFYKAIYGTHPYASPVIGTREAVEALTVEQILKHYRRYFVANNGILAMVGALSRKDAEALAQRISSRLASGEVPPALPAVKPLESGSTLKIPFPSEQAHVYVGQPGMRRGEPDYFPLYVGNHVLGGSGFNSRLVKDVRVKRGLSYSVYSYFIPEARKGPFELNLQTRIDQTDDALDVARNTVRYFVEKGPTTQELEAAKRNITGGFPLRIDSNADIVSYLVVIGFYDLPLNYLDAFNDQVVAVNEEQIKSAFRRQIDVDNMVTVVVGGP